MQYKVYGTTQKRILQRNVNTECYQYMEITTEKKVTGKKKTKNNVDSLCRHPGLQKSGLN